MSRSFSKSISTACTALMTMTRLYSNQLLTSAGSLAMPVAILLAQPLAAGEPTPKDSSYGFSAGSPIRTGKQRGGVLDQTVYLESLRGPQGQVVTYKRIGSCCMFKTAEGPFGNGLLDKYEVNYEGLATPAVLYFDMYNSEPLQVPNGFGRSLDPPSAPAKALARTHAPAATTNATDKANATAATSAPVAVPAMTAEEYRDLIVNVADPLFGNPTAFLLVLPASNLRDIIANDQTTASENPTTRMSQYLTQEDIAYFKSIQGYNELQRCGLIVVVRNIERQRNRWATAHVPNYYGNFIRRSSIGST